MRSQGLYPHVDPPRIDYDLMRREHPKLKAALTRAKNSGDPMKVAKAVDRAVQVWDQVGCWPDDWNTWRIALEDAWAAFTRNDDEGGPQHDADCEFFRRVARPFA